VLAGLTLPNGIGEYWNGDGERGGGGILVSSSTLQIDASAIRDNLARRFGQGGGIYGVDAAIIELSDVQVTGNEAYNGGGIGLYGFTGICDVRNSTVNDNEATGEGGGIYLHTQSLRQGGVHDDPRPGDPRGGTGPALCGAKSAAERIGRLAVCVSPWRTRNDPRRL